MNHQPDVTKAEKHTQYPIIVFDGVCALCDASVQFVLRHDQQELFHFAPLQGETGQRLLQQTNIDPEVIQSVVLIEAPDRGSKMPKAYLRSDAALRIAASFTGKWRLLRHLRFVPRPLRDMVYKLVARWRYRLFGKYQQCVVPAASWQERFHN